MATASIELLGGHLDGADVADELDRLYCYEQVVAHWCTGVENRLIGFASFVLGDELRKVAAEARAVGAQLAARAFHRVAEATTLHGITIGRIVQPLWDRRITPATLFEAYEAVWTQSAEDLKEALEARMNAPDSPGDTHPGLAERCGGHRYPFAPGLRGDLPLARLADLDRNCSAALARKQRHLMTVMSWPEIRAGLGQEAPQGEATPEGAVSQPGPAELSPPNNA